MKFQFRGDTVEIYKNLYYIGCKRFVLFHQYKSQETDNALIYTLSFLNKSQLSFSLKNDAI